MKIVVFDLDETLGYFTEMGIFWDCLKKYFISINGKTLTQKDFNEIMDLYPEFLRPNILNILSYLKNKKNSNCCYKMMIYTNNNGPREWVHHIISYFEHKLNYKLIDQIIAAFKVNGQRVEICRTTHNKTYNDFIRCSKVPKNAKICFLDDNYYPDMANENIYYINVKPYYHDLKFEDMIIKFRESKIGKELLINKDLNDFINFMFNEIKNYKYDVIEKKQNEQEIDELIGKQIIVHLQEFFSKSDKTKTLKNRNRYRNKSRRRY